MALSPANRARLQASFACAGSLVLRWRFPHPVTLALVAIAVGLALLAWLAPSRFAPIQRWLDRGTHALVIGVSWIVLGLVYFGLFTPLRVLRSQTGRPAISQRADRSAKTYLTPLSSASAGRFDRQF